MLSGTIKLQLTQKLLVTLLPEYIQIITVDSNYGVIRLNLIDGTLLYLRFNNYNEYSYNVIFSSIVYDRIRFDNFDDNWAIKTRPHHFHPRFNKNGYESPMKGEPDHDITLLSEYIKKQILEDPKIRF